MRRQRSDVVDCVVDLLRVRLGKPKHDAAIALGGDGGDPVEHAGEARGDRRVPRAREGEHHVLSGDGRAVVPGSTRIELECQRHRVATHPAPGQERHEVTIAGGRERGAQPGQTQEQLVGDLVVGHVRLRALHQRRDRQGGLLAGHDDDGRGRLWRLRRDRVAEGEHRAEQARDKRRGQHSPWRPTRHRHSGESDAEGMSAM